MIRSIIPRIFLFLSRIGADPNDSDDLRLQKTLVVGSTLMIIPAGIVWGVTYILFSEPLAALFPLIYVVRSLLSLGLFSIRHDYRAFRFRQLLFILLLPFLGMVAWADSLIQARSFCGHSCVHSVHGLCVNNVNPFAGFSLISV